MRMALKIVIVGGHGKVSLRLGRLLASAGHTVTSLIRDQSHANDIKEIGAIPLLLSLEDATVSEFATLFSSGIDLVYFSAGAGGKGGEERTKAVDYEGAVKVYDALEQTPSPPRLIVVSGLDIRDPDKIPAHYNDGDKAVSERMRKSIPVWVKWKYEADKDLAKRTAFKWFILRPGGLLDSPGTGKAAIGRTHLTQQIPRDDVAEALFLLAERVDVAGLALDMVGGDVPISDALDIAIKKGETDFLG